MPVNEKKLLEKFLTIETALRLLAKECVDARKELGDRPDPSNKVREQNQRRQQLLMNRQRSRIKSAERKLQSQ